MGAGEPVITGAEEVGIRLPMIFSETGTPVTLKDSDVAEKQKFEIVRLQL
jgi:hypothetical protein